MLIIVFSVLVLSAVLRFWQLGTIPDGFHSDEAAYGYNAYSILKTGKDEYGDPYPLILRSFNDYKGAVYAYFVIPFIRIFGLTEWSVRAPSAVFGILFVFLTYGVVNAFSVSRTLALVSMALAAVSPYGILLSRVQSDPLVSVFFFYLGFYFFLMSVTSNRLINAFFGVVTTVVSFYTHPATRLFVIPFYLLIGIRLWGSWRKAVRYEYVFVLGFLSIFVFGLFFTRAGSRFAQVSIFSKKDVQLPLDQQLRETGVAHVPVPVARLFHNKVTAYGQYFFDNFAKYVGYEFLFRQAGEPVREKIPDAGVLLFIELPFLLAGLYASFQKKLNYGISGVFWFLLVPVILSIASDESPNIHRFFLASIPIHMLVAIGITAVVNAVKFQKRFVALAIVVLFFVNVLSFMNQLFVHQPVHDPIFRNNADKELARALKRVSPSYDVVVTQKVLEHMLFFWPVEPAVYQSQGSPRDYDNARYGKFLFVTDECPSSLQNRAVSDSMPNRVLFVDKTECAIPADMKVIQQIYYRNSLVAYRLVENIDTETENHE